MKTADKIRFNIIRRIGCVCCILKYKARETDIHHIVSGHKRHGNSQTLGLCPWHHRGVKANGYDRQEMMGLLGVSLAQSKREFHHEFGLESGLLKVQDFLIKEFESSPWLDYHTPVDVRRRSIELWTREKIP